LIYCHTFEELAESEPRVAFRNTEVALAKIVDDLNIRKKGSEMRDEGYVNQERRRKGKRTRPSCYY